ncbi:rhomboid family intramembrane serine protease [Tenacibaculum maritimum]|uniref:rhomboid family intramembrane serine protease n=1 Tax=Tenacibaculum maritimum TaxID=107401 RepID=UPI0038774AB0
MTFFQNIQYRFKNANIVEKLIYINIVIFLLVFLSNTFGFLFESKQNFLVKWLSLPASFNGFLTKPWTLISYGFLHVDFIHILFNLIALFYIGNLFLEYFTPKQLINFYVFGTVFGGLIFLLSYNYFPALLKNNSISVLLGASAGISAIFIGIATYIPNYQLKIRFIGYVHLWKLAAIWIALDIIQIPMGNAGGHLAHIGGACFGFLYVSQASNTSIEIFSPLKNFFQKKEKPLKTVYKSKTATKKATTKNENQQQIDAILDKISKSGYDTLTKAEKDFLFRQGKN